MSDENYDDSFVDAANDNHGVILPSFQDWEFRKLYDYQKHIIDYTSIEELDKSLVAARKALFILTSKINTCERYARQAKTAYDRAHRREYIGSTEKTESAKRARADLKCEELENEWIKYDQLKEELVRASFAMKSELNTLQTIAHNLRQQLKSL